MKWEFNDAYWSVINAALDDFIQSIDDRINNDPEYKPWGNALKGITLKVKDSLQDAKPDWI